MSDLFQDELDRFQRTQNLVLSLLARELRAADALEAAEATIANLEHRLQQADELATAAYRDAEAAEAKLAAIDALHRGEYDVDPDSFTMGQKFCVTDDEEWPCSTHRILHPEEEL